MVSVVVEIGIGAVTVDVKGIRPESELAVLLPVPGQQKRRFVDIGTGFLLLEVVESVVAFLSSEDFARSFLQVIATWNSS